MELRSKVVLIFLKMAILQVATRNHLVL